MTFITYVIQKSLISGDRRLASGILKRKDIVRTQNCLIDGKGKMYR